MYEREIAARDCIVGLGFDVAEMPSEQSYVESFNAADRWDIVQQIPPFASKAEYERVWSECPPPLWFPSY
jgi:hypothetical protein